MTFFPLPTNLEEEFLEILDFGVVSPFLSTGVAVLFLRGLFPILLSILLDEPDGEFSPSVNNKDLDFFSRYALSIKMSGTQSDLLLPLCPRFYFIVLYFIGLVTDFLHSRQLYSFLGLFKSTDSAFSSW